MKCLEFEDLRGLTALHFQRIKELEEIEANLRGNLAYEKGEKEHKIKQLAEKTKELEDKEAQYQAKVAELTKERQNLREAKV